MSRSLSGKLTLKCGLAILVQALPFAISDATPRDTGNSASGFWAAGDGSFAPTVDHEAGSTPTSVLAVDMDASESIDPVVGNRGSNSVSILRNISSIGSAGDVNCDDAIDLLDLVLLGNHLDGLTALVGTCNDNPGDVNLDSLVNEADYTYLLDLISTIPTSISLQSDPGDYVGQGGVYLYTQANTLITVTASGGYLCRSVSGDAWWYGDFQVPDSLSQLAPGTYSNLTRFPFHDPAAGGLSWYGEGRGCNTLTGSFVIDRVVYCNGQLSLIDLHFEQHCEGSAPALRGTIHWDINDPATPPGPVVPIPPGHWQPAPGSAPALGK